MSKKNKNSNFIYETVRKIRGDWGSLNPVTKVIPNKKHDYQFDYEREYEMENTVDFNDCSNYRMSDYQRGVIAAQLNEPFDEEESANWMEGYFHEIYHPNGDTMSRDDTFEPGRPYWDEMEANP